MHVRSTAASCATANSSASLGASVRNANWARGAAVYNRNSHATCVSPIRGNTRKSSLTGTQSLEATGEPRAVPSNTKPRDVGSSAWSPSHMRPSDWICCRRRPHSKGPIETQPCVARKVGLKTPDQVQRSLRRRGDGVTSSK